MLIPITQILRRIQQEISVVQPSIPRLFLLSEKREVSQVDLEGESNERDVSHLTVASEMNICIFTNTCSLEPGMYPGIQKTSELHQYQ